MARRVPVRWPGMRQPQNLNLASTDRPWHRPGALRLLRSEAVQALNFQEEKNAVRDAYGKSMFGQGCLLARRLVERGVPFVEVGLGGPNRNTGFGCGTRTTPTTSSGSRA